MPLLLALVAGAMLPLQAALNARLGRALGASIWAASVSGAVTTLTLVVVGAAILRVPPRVAGVADLPWWAWTGGLCGVFALVGMTAAAPRLGAATMIAAVICGQVIFSLILDRFGLFGQPSGRLVVRRHVRKALNPSESPFVAMRTKREGILPLVVKAEFRDRTSWRRNGGWTEEVVDAVYRVCGSRAVRLLRGQRSV